MAFTGSVNKFWIFWHFPTRESKVFPLFSSQQIGYSFHYPAIFLFKSAVNRWENGWYSLLIGVFQQQKIALKEVFLQRQCVSFHFPRTGKCIENAWKPRVVQCSRVGQRKEIWCFLAFVSCLRRENVLLSATHHPNAVIPTHFYEVAIRLSCEKWYWFLYSSVFYTVSHLDIYKYVYYTYIMFWWRKKKNAMLFHSSALCVFVFVGRQCSSHHLCPCFIAKHMVFTGSENKFWIFENAAFFMHFSDIFRQENPKFSRSFQLGELEYSFHYPTVFLHS